MGKNHIFKYISRDEMKETLEAFHEVAKLNVELIDDEGKVLLHFGEEYPYCREFRKHCQHGRSCAEEHVHASQMAVDFGESYVFSCHSCLNHIVYPTLVKGQFFGSVIAGPFLMDAPDAEMISELTKQNEIPTDGLLRLMEYAGGIPIYSPEQVTQISTLFRHLMRSALVESRAIMASNNEKLLQQSRINESIQLYKNSGVREDRTYPVDLENALVSTIKANQIDKARDILNTLLGHILLYEGHNTEKVKIRCIELCAVLSRTAISRGGDPNLVLDMNQNLISSLAKAKTIYDICYTLQDNIEIFTDNLLQPSDRNSRIVKSAVEYVAQHFSEDISLASVAEELHVNTSYLSTLFRQVTGTTFKEHLNRVRVEEAERLLANTDYAVMEIAIACGYRDQSYFTKVFKKMTGLTPKLYR